MTIDLALNGSKYTHLHVSVDKSSGGQLYVSANAVKFVTDNFGTSMHWMPFSDPGQRWIVEPMKRKNAKRINSEVEKIKSQCAAKSGEWYERMSALAKTAGGELAS